MITELNEMGPIDYLVIAFPGGKVTGEGFAHLVDLVDRGIIRILDLAFEIKQADGSLVKVLIGDLDGDGEFDLAVFEGASSGLLGTEDLDEAGADLEPGDCAAILIYENVWAAPLATTLRRNGARLVAGGRIPVQEFLRVLDELDTPVP
ncbi:DUF6325 family protein [Actinospica acidithermotolerans]|uniref:DUF6325 family protein n=1 Tax=Actinospica acidithermotolerans TaxID=2828514 RepID=UPI0020129BE4|nr:DUF6325 family protein [Actinospica acidithermotolerans]